MRILYVSPWLPFPPDAREMVRPYHQIQFMAQRHDVDLICFAATGIDSGDARSHLSTLCKRVEILPLETHPQDPSSLRNLMSSRPLALRRFYRKDFLRRLQEIGESRRDDLVVIYSAGMVPYLNAFPETRRVVDLVDVGSLRWTEYAELVGFPANRVYHTEAERLRLIELEAAAKAQQVVFASEEEAEAFRALCPGNDRITSLKTPVNPRLPLEGSWAAEPTILFHGHLDHFPNADAAIYFLQEIFPLIRRQHEDVRLVIVGKNPPGEVSALASRSGVVLRDRSVDTPEVFRDAWLAVAPHRIAHGVRNEILEAMAVGVPVVATEEAAVSLDLDPAEHLVVESGPERFAASVVELLGDPERLRELGERGHKAVHNNYSHWSVTNRLEEILKRAAEVPFIAPE